ncbi:hypothetical protein DTO013E5_1746 [Penicillium roqueforti]|nr:hypothetical protein CBS147355_4471 [Penicillium roqueforti]KAI2705761.1 hypothetical protein CBS147372_2064 [Penicillium roqueforti]KAI2727652.1 hypothetical protein CBS147354_3325 [Penicillium roqueforti]KAI2745634.1 hypothetical protein DTO012A1_2273 [Penicillium roqueforti]KAI2749934.1 hypothetical protein DTO013F2_5118 [Penicillium roqueforti]
MGNTSSQLEPYPEIADDFGDIVPETPNPPKVGGTKKNNKEHISSETEALSPVIGKAYGTERLSELDSNMSNPSKRKRDSEPERKKKIKKPRKSENSVAESPSPERSSTRFEIAIHNAPTPSQPTTSKPKSSSKKVRKQNGKNLNILTSSTAQPTLESTVAEGPSAVKQLAATKRTPAPDSPNTEDSNTPGGKTKGVRSSRIRERDNLKIGFYTPDEVRKIEAYKVNVCTMHGIPSAKFDEMVQHSERTRELSVESPFFSYGIHKGDFWDEIYALLPDRDRRSVYRFMRRHFQASAQRAHEWSKEQDDELIELHAQHGPKWTFIGKLIGRSDDDVTQRWKNKLEHQNTMNQGAWSEEEHKMFLDAVESTWVTMKPMLPDKAGKDMYELDERLIVWGNISKEIGYVRSRQQCADKWRKIVKQVMVLRANGQPDAVFDPKLAAKKSAHWNMRLETQRKSSQFVNEDTDDDEDMITTTPSSKPHDEAAPSSIVNANAESDHEAQSKEGEPNLPAPLKNDMKSKFKRKHNEDSASGPIEKAPSSPGAPQKSKEERKREKKERKERKREKKEQREKKRQEKEKGEQIEQEVPEDKAARKEQKWKRREEKKKRKILEEERLAAEEANQASGSNESPKEKKKSKKQKQASIGSPTSLVKPSHSVVEAFPLPTSPVSHGADAVDDEYDSDGGDEDSEVYFKYESDSEEL